MSAGADAVYDSARPPAPLADELHALWRWRGLLRLLVTREVVLRYKRSLLGVWWVLLNPLLTMAVLWVVFSHVFRFETGVPYAVYLLSGLVLYTFFDQAVSGAGGAMLSNAAVLSKVHVPSEVVCVSVALGAAVNFALGLLPLLAIMLIAGVALQPTLPLVLLPAVLLLVTAVGLGLLLAPLTVRFQDTTQITRVALLLGLYASPVFWPPSIVEGRWGDAIEVNPLFHFLRAVRATLYEGTLGPWSAWAVMAGTAAVSLVVGLLVFHRTSRAAALML